MAAYVVARYQTPRPGRAGRPPLLQPSAPRHPGLPKRSGRHDQNVGAWAVLAFFVQSIVEGQASRVYMSLEVCVSA